MAKTTGDSRANPWSPWFDYEKLGLFLDRLMIMTYDEHNPRTAPGSTEGNRNLAVRLRSPNVLDDHTRENKSKKVMEWSSQS